MTIMSYFIKNPSSGGGVKKPGLFRLFVPQKPIPLKIPHDFFLITPSPLLEISLSSINLPCLDFYWNSPVAYLNNKRNYFFPHMHLIHISCVILIYNMKIIWSLWDDHTILVNWCRMSHTLFWCSTNALIVPLICLILSYIFSIQLTLL